MKSFLSRFGFRSVEQSGIDTPPSGQRALFAKSDGWYDLDDTGAETQLGGSTVVGIPAGGSTSDVLTKDSGTDYDASWQPAPTGGGGGIAGFCGDGADGNVTISGTTTLTTDMYYDTLTVQSGGILNTAGFTVYAKTAIVVDSGGAARCNGNNGSGQTGGSAVGAGSLLGNQAGASGGGSAGSNTSSPANGALGGRGGNGGTGSNGAGGTSGTIPAPASTIGTRTPRTLPCLALATFPGSATSSIRIGAGSGGASGGGGVSPNFGGGGGACGGVMVLNSPSITNNGTISANGGNGANGVSGNAAGGGGGGGGVVIVNCETFTGTTPTATGGTGGNGSGSGTAGANGSVGTVIVTEWT